MNIRPVSDLRNKFPEADRVAESTDIRYSLDEVVDRVRKRIIKDV